MTIRTVPCNLVDLQAAIDASTPGDTLLMAAGSTHATTAVTISKALDIRLDPASEIIDDYTAGDLFTLSEPPLGEIRVSGGRFLTGLGPVNSTPFHFVRATGFFVWSDSWFHLGYGSNCFGLRTNKGLITRNTFEASLGGGNCSNNASALRLKPMSYGDVWNRPHKWGSADVNQDQSAFFEGNTLINLFEGIDVDDNGLLVFRHNRLTNSAFIHHGVDTGYDGARASEVYENDFISDMRPVCGDLPAGTNGMIYIRGGTTRIFNNRIPDIISQAWGDKSEVTFTMEELRRNAGRVPCTKTYPGFHQTGWGYTVGAVQVLGQKQDIEPIYIWGNTGNGNYANPAIRDYVPNECGANAPTAAEFIKIGREIILGPAPNYTPSAYPHPRSTASGIPPIIPPIEPPIIPPILPPVNNPPEVSIKWPLDGQKVKWNKDLTISVIATDDAGIAWLSIHINEQVVKEASATAMTYDWNPRPYRGQSVVIGAAARDSKGIVTLVQVTVQVR